MKIGFTGTRRGMTTPQFMAFDALVRRFGITEFHHGDCVGSDAEAGELVHFEIHCPIIIHPPSDETHAAKSPYFAAILPAKTHFARNRDIVDACDVLIATPCEMEHQPHGGTWYTHDYAVKKGKKVYVIWPDGNTKESS